MLSSKCKTSKRCIRIHATGQSLKVAEGHSYAVEICFDIEQVVMNYLLLYFIQSRENPAICMYGSIVCNDV